jgi:hypothetical protein
VDVEAARDQLDDVKVAEEDQTPKIDLNTVLLGVVIIMLAVLIGLTVLRSRARQGTADEGGRPRLEPARPAGRSDWEELDQTLPDRGD